MYTPGIVGGTRPKDGRLRQTQIYVVGKDSAGILTALSHLTSDYSLTKSSYTRQGDQARKSLRAVGGIIDPGLRILLARLCTVS